MSSSEPTRVWIVEDNDEYRQSVCRVFERQPQMECSADFRSVEQLLAQLRVTSPLEYPAVVLLDVDLPGMSGLDGIKQIHAVDECIRIVLLTVFSDDEKIFRAFCAGASGYLLKAFGVREIGGAVREVIDGGAPMTPAVARRVLDLMTTFAPKSRTAEYRLTDREQEVLELMVDGLTKKEIAQKVELSVHTVSTHLRHIYEKLRVNTNTAAVAKAIREGLA